MQPRPAAAHPPARLYRAQQVRELDRRFIEDHQVPGFELMQRAARTAFNALRQQWPLVRRISILAGPGNNGGDGLLIGVLARRAGFDVSLFYLGNESKARGDAARALAAYRDSGGELLTDLKALPSDTELVVDALLGTGLSRPLEGRLLDAVEQVNAMGRPVFAVDIPTGLDADTGRVWGQAVRAELSISFIGAKLGMYTGAGPACTGACLFDDLQAPAGIYADMPPAACTLGHSHVNEALPRRARDAHKGDFGHVLCVGGNQGMSGAIRLASEAALRSGAGLVSVATAAAHAAQINQGRPELMVRGIDRPAQLDSLLQAASVVAVGPGLGQDGWAQRMFSRVLESGKPLIMDADALNLLAQQPLARGNWMLTPHPGEAARLLGCSTGDIQNDRPAAIARLCEQYDATVILKGAGSLVKSPADTLWLAGNGNPGMSSGGMGDLLTGLAAGLQAQVADLPLAARLAAWLHGQAGDQAALAGERGLLASDLLPWLHRLVNPENAQDSE